ncbi:unnamed protein product [Danaus chrysippus]|uniref:(African queen) hypothetical protein n=1 Tax=Danaus chrysippus TaxID=151541 RepID=A0A8J2QD36_9NEOP|nr:unnamed protein product [Danaus chrysippus]
MESRLMFVSAPLMRKVNDFNLYVTCSMSEMPRTDASRTSGGNYTSSASGLSPSLTAPEARYIDIDLHK